MLFTYVSSHQSSSKHIYKRKKPSLFSSLFFFFLTHFFLRIQAEISSLIAFLCSHKGKNLCWKKYVFFRSVVKQRTYFTLDVIDKHREQERDKTSHSHWKIFIESSMLIYCLLSFFFCKLRPFTSRNFRQKIQFFYIFLIFKDMYSHS